MSRSLVDPTIFALAYEESGHLILRSAAGTAHVFILENDIIRVAVLPGGDWRFNRTWAIVAGADDVPETGRNREDISGFSCPRYIKRESEGTLVIETAKLRLTIKLSGFLCRWEMLRGDDWVEICKDRATQAYNFGWWGEGAYHYLTRHPSEQFFGLGECSGEMDRTGRRIRLANTDALGYSARSTDPLYKHIPFYITRDQRTNAAFGLFYDTLSDCEFDFGCERSNYHGFFRGFRAGQGDVDYYMIAGPTVADVTRRFTWLTGQPAFAPRWSLGYSGSTMSYTDAPDAQARMTEFLIQCAHYDILCESFHLSSGYTSIGTKRYVFHWNRNKFPDPSAFVADYASHGVRLIPNIKPCLLTDHPEFEAAAKRHIFIEDESGAPHLVQFWGALGAYVDFTNPIAAAWWREHVSAALLSHGMAATWNDNNEYEIRDPSARAAFFGDQRPAISCKPLQTELMVRASRDAQLVHAPQKRPFLVTRAGFAGMQRYGQTWSGDNVTSWETLKYNIKMGLGLALSGVSNVGHDIGGFSGPAPDEELFLRWVESSLFMPRFSIHSWNDDGTVNEPWMHGPVAARLVSDLIKLRARFSPYLYDLLWRAHRDFEPMIRPTFYNFPSDMRCYDSNDEMMIGANVLAVPVVEPGQSERSVYLPAGTNWFEIHSGDEVLGGEIVTRPAPLGRPLLFARAGSAIAVNLADQHFNMPADERGFLIFPLARGRFEASSFEDDGETFAYRNGVYLEWRILVEAAADHIAIGVSRSGTLKPEGDRLTLILPRRESRPVSLTGASLLDDSIVAAGRSLRIKLNYV